MFYCDNLEDAGSVKSIIEQCWSVKCWDLSSAYLQGILIRPRSQTILTCVFNDALLIAPPNTGVFAACKDPPYTYMGEMPDRLERSHWSTAFMSSSTIFERLSQQNRNFKSTSTFSALNTFSYSVFHNQQVILLQFRSINAEFHFNLPKP